ncbi:MAG: SGNH/GDSL hydrolase family protein [Eubacterium sp.]|nr:SGNH/GDSL hydrolase family protein [Eubacterium sp.]
MNGPAAPKDPEKKRPYFYIMRDKEIFGTRQEDGRGIQYLYQDSGRLINSAQIVGNIEDKEMLRRMETVEGFRKVVHSIGVSVETEDPKEQVEFIFQMYGKNDLYGGGTNLKATFSGDGAETRIYLSDADWQTDDHVPGQIKILMDTPEKLAKTSVRLYLNDGYTAPEVSEEQNVDVSSAPYREMIEKSLIQTGNTYRIYRAIRRARLGEDVTLAYIGGSITQGAGATPINTECYAYKSFERFRDLVGKKENIHFVKAGVGGTPSELGMIRFDRDVLRDNVQPDIVVVEFAVNDEGDETKGDCYESLVRKILKLPNHPAVILLFSVFADDGNLQDRLIPVGVRYDLPMVSVKNAVVPEFYDKKKRILTKNQYFYDMFHPSNLGHTIMADCLANLYRKVLKAVEEKGTFDSDYRPELFDGAPAIGCTFDNVRLLDKKDVFEKSVIDCGGFTQTDTVLQSVEMDLDLNQTPEFPYNWMYDGAVSKEKTYFEMKITCKALVMVFKDSGETDAAKAEVYVDGKWVRTADPYVNGWLHTNPLLIFSEPETKEHKVRIEIAEGDEDKKCTILGFGYVV